MSAKSETPRTDEQAAPYPIAKDEEAPFDWVPAEFSKCLERELAQARAELSRVTLLNDGHQRLATTYRERAEKAEVENKALREDAWQPIETAPTDGSAILVCCGSWITTAHWHRQARAWFNNGPTYEPIPRDELPTHWRHLPQPVGSAALDAARKVEA